jgi:hypothetical protein
MEALYSVDRLLCNPGSSPFFRTVSFSDEVQVDHIPSKKVLSHRQRNALWYPQPTKSRSILKQVMCLSGSARTNDGDEIFAEEARSERHFPVAAVLAEQESQREGHSTMDPQRIATVYHRCSSYSSICAQMRALEVQSDATEYLSQPKTPVKARIKKLEK